VFQLEEEVRRPATAGDALAEAACGREREAEEDRRGPMLDREMLHEAYAENREACSQARAGGGLR
jgi:hypothetical protein